MSTYTEYFTSDDVLRQKPISVKFSMNSVSDGESDSIFFKKFKFNGLEIPALIRGVEGGAQASTVSSGTAAASVLYLSVQPASIPTFSIELKVVISVEKRKLLLEKVAEVKEGKVKGDDFVIELSEINSKQAYKLDQEWAALFDKLPNLRPKNKNFEFRISQPGEYDEGGSIEKGNFTAVIYMGDLTLKDMKDDMNVTCTESTEKRVYKPSTAVT